MLPCCSRTPCTPCVPSGLTLQIYGKAVRQLLSKFGGKGIFAGDVAFLALGQVEELWDEVAIAMYPKRADLLAMSSSREWKEVSVHHSAGLAGRLNIETVARSGIFD